MDLSQEWVYNHIVEPNGWDWANEYGEPGYGSIATQMIVLGNYWCRCGKHPRTGEPRRGVCYDDGLTKAGDLHTYSDHHPRLWHWMEHNGFEFEWYDEWVLDHKHSKAYRTQADSYTWTRTAIVTEWGDLLTPDSPIEEWIAWAVGEPTRCLMPYHAALIKEAGFVKANENEGGSWGGGDSYESGWHAGQDADPKEIFAALEMDHDEIVFVLDYNSQFYSGFSVYVRDEEQ